MATGCADKSLSKGWTWGAAAGLGAGLNAALPVGLRQTEPLWLWACFAPHFSSQEASNVPLTCLDACKQLWKWCLDWMQKNFTFKFFRSWWMICWPKQVMSSLWFSSIRCCSFHGSLLEKSKLLMFPLSHSCAASYNKKKIQKWETTIKNQRFLNEDVDITVNSKNLFTRDILVNQYQTGLKLRLISLNCYTIHENIPPKKTKITDTNKRQRGCQECRGSRQTKIPQVLC